MALMILPSAIRTSSNFSGTPAGSFSNILMITACAAETPWFKVMPLSVASYPALSGKAARMRCRIASASNGRDIVSVAPSAQACIEAWCRASARTNSRGTAL